MPRWDIGQGRYVPEEEEEPQPSAVLDPHAPVPSSRGAISGLSAGWLTRPLTPQGLLETSREQQRQEEQAAAATATVYNYATWPLDILSALGGQAIREARTPPHPGPSAPLTDLSSWRRGLGNLDVREVSRRTLQGAPETTLFHEVRELVAGSERGPRAVPRLDIVDVLSTPYLYPRMAVETGVAAGRELVSGDIRGAGRELWSGAGEVARFAHGHAASLAGITLDLASDPIMWTIPLARGARLGSAAARVRLPAIVARPGRLVEEVLGPRARSIFEESLSGRLGGILGRHAPAELGRGAPAMVDEVRSAIRGSLQAAGLGGDRAARAIVEGETWRSMTHELGAGWSYAGRPLGRYTPFAETVGEDVALRRQARALLGDIGGARYTSAVEDIRGRVAFRRGAEIPSEQQVGEYVRDAWRAATGSTLAVPEGGLADLLALEFKHWRPTAPIERVNLLPTVPGLAEHAPGPLYAIPTVPEVLGTAAEAMVPSRVLDTMRLLEPGERLRGVARGLSERLVPTQPTTEGMRAAARRFLDSQISRLAGREAGLRGDLGRLGAEFVTLGRETWAERVRVPLALPAPRPEGEVMPGARVQPEARGPTVAPAAPLIPEAPVVPRAPAAPLFEPTARGLLEPQAPIAPPAAEVPPAPTAAPGEAAGGRLAQVVQMVSEEGGAVDLAELRGRLGLSDRDMAAVVRDGITEDLIDVAEGRVYLAAAMRNRELAQRRRSLGEAIARGDDHGQVPQAERDEAWTRRANAIRSEIRNQQLELEASERQFEAAVQRMQEWQAAQQPAAAPEAPAPSEPWAVQTTIFGERETVARRPEAPPPEQIAMDEIAGGYAVERPEDTAEGVERMVEVERDVAGPPTEPPVAPEPPAVSEPQPEAELDPYAQIGRLTSEEQADAERAARELEQPRPGPTDSFGEEVVDKARARAAVPGAAHDPWADVGELTDYQRREAERHAMQDAMTADEWAGFIAEEDSLAAGAQRAAEHQAQWEQQVAAMPDVEGHLKTEGLLEGAEAYRSMALPLARELYARMKMLEARHRNRYRELRTERGRRYHSYQDAAKFLRRYAATLKRAIDARTGGRRYALAGEMARDVSNEGLRRKREEYRRRAEITGEQPSSLETLEGSIWTSPEEFVYDYMRLQRDPFYKPKGVPDDLWIRQKEWMESIRGELSYGGARSDFEYYSGQLGDEAAEAEVAGLVAEQEGVAEPEAHPGVQRREPWDRLKALQRHNPAMARAYADGLLLLTQHADEQTWQEISGRRGSFAARPEGAMPELMMPAAWVQPGGEMMQGPLAADTAREAARAERERARAPGPSAQERRAAEREARLAAVVQGILATEEALLDTRERRDALETWGDEVGEEMARLARESARASREKRHRTEGWLGRLKADASYWPGWRPDDIHRMKTVLGYSTRIRTEIADQGRRLFAAMPAEDQVLASLVAGMQSHHLREPMAGAPAEGELPAGTPVVFGEQFVAEFLWRALGRDPTAEQLEAGIKGLPARGQRIFKAATAGVAWMQILYHGGIVTPDGVRPLPTVTNLKRLSDELAEWSGADNLGMGYIENYWPKPSVEPPVAEELLAARGLLLHNGLSEEYVDELLAEANRYFHTSIEERATYLHNMDRLYDMARGVIEHGGITPEIENMLPVLMPLEAVDWYGNQAGRVVMRHGLYGFVRDRFPTVEEVMAEGGTEAVERMVRAGWQPLRIAGQALPGLEDRLLPPNYAQVLEARLLGQTVMPSIMRTFLGKWLVRPTRELWHTAQVGVLITRYFIAANIFEYVWRLEQQGLRTASPEHGAALAAAGRVIARTLLESHEIMPMDTLGGRIKVGLAHAVEAMAQRLVGLGISEERIKQYMAEAQEQAVVTEGMGAQAAKQLTAFGERLGWSAEDIALSVAARVGISDEARRIAVWTGKHFDLAGHEVNGLLDLVTGVVFGIDNLHRLGAYIALRERGETPEEARISIRDHTAEYGHSADSPVIDTLKAFSWYVVYFWQSGTQIARMTTQRPGAAAAVAETYRKRGTYLDWDAEYQQLAAGKPWWMQRAGEWLPIRYANRLLEPDTQPDPAGALVAEDGPYMVFVRMRIPPIEEPGNWAQYVIDPADAVTGAAMPPVRMLTDASSYGRQWDPLRQMPMAGRYLSGARRVPGNPADPTSPWGKAALLQNVADEELAAYIDLEGTRAAVAQIAQAPGDQRTGLWAAYLRRRGVPRLAAADYTDWRDRPELAAQYELEKMRFFFDLHLAGNRTGLSFYAVPVRKLLQGMNLRQLQVAQRLAREKLARGETPAIMPEGDFEYTYAVELEKRQAASPKGPVDWADQVKIIWRGVGLPEAPGPWQEPGGQGEPLAPEEPINPEHPPRS